MTARTLLLFNPLAKGVRSRRRSRRVLERLADVGIPARPVQLGRGFDLEAELGDGTERVLVYGGDGTLHRLLPGLVRSGLPVGLIPGGTANVLAREVGIPNRIEKAIEVLSRGRVKPICLGQADAEPFLLMAGMGPDGYLLNQVPDSLKRFLGIVAFWLTGALRFWNYRLAPIRVQTRDEEFRATLAIVSNCRYYGRHLSIAPRATVYEPALDLVLFQSSNHLRYLLYLWTSIVGRHVALGDVICRKVTGVRAESSGGTGIYVQTDGEAAGMLPMRFRLFPERLNLIVP